MAAKLMEWKSTLDLSREDAILKKMNYEK